MRKRNLLMSLAAAAVTAAGVAVAVPAATASEATAAGLSCTSDSTVNKVALTCSYNGSVRGQAIFFKKEEPEILRAIDLKQDGSGVTAHITWFIDGEVAGAAGVRDAGGGTSKRVAVPDLHVVEMMMCLDGGTCGPPIRFYA